MSYTLGYRASGSRPGLSDADSRVLQNLRHAVALYFMYYNYCRVHQTIKTTPAVASGLADHVWTIEEIVRLLETTNDAG